MRRQWLHPRPLSELPPSSLVAQPVTQLVTPTSSLFLTYNLTTTTTTTMTTTPDFSWLPVSGRHSVTVGPSLGRALKSRKGGPPPKNNKVPNVDFFSLRCAYLLHVSAVSRETYTLSDGFQPESIDVSKPGTIEVKRPNEPNGIHVERACAQVCLYAFVVEL